MQRGRGVPTSAASISSLVLGILSVVFVAVGYLAFVAGAAAVVFGIIGVGRTNKGTVSGRALAIAGIVLGVVGLILVLLTTTVSVTSGP